MQVPLQITLRGLDGSPTLEASIREKAARLEHLCDEITSCRVVVECGARKSAAQPFNVRIDLAIPGEEIVADHGHDQDAYAAVRAAFDLARRRLEEHMHRRLSERRR